MNRATSLIRSARPLNLRLATSSPVCSSSAPAQYPAVRFLATKPSKSSHHEGIPATPKTLELLKQTLYDKKKKLRDITERQALAGSINTSEPTSDPTSSSPAIKVSAENEKSSDLQDHKPDRTMPIFASPADMTVRLPNVIRDFSQPEDAEIVKIAIIGSPNAGKSTIVNDLVQSTVSIVSIRAHTTRERIKAVLTHQNKQIVLYDTPGVVPEKNVSRLNRELVTASWKAIEDADHLLVVMDCNKLLDHTLITEKYIFQRLEKLERKPPATIIYNKMDLVKGRDERLQNFVQEYSQQYPNFVKTIYTSAQTPKVGIQELRSHLLSLTRPGPWLYPADQKTDQADLSRVEDMIRSELYELLKVPYNVKQVNVGWTELEDNVLRIDQYLVVDRPGLKKIIVGTNGSAIKDLTLNARQKIGKALQRRVMLNLQVKVKAKKQ
ncbi:P-loop containing nucleoside triphosphate hydrolase protein [Gamsiella multidivaricata]|uniref:P-loop containing nucleoside triphosphate hydrolase protein n=1 Tax=Gamsiella multidivaricata TaxID=101098 RepID=UPI002220F480|nr:P-loop containing nucleoside triphosphate hydrolase protein [Gamsiella multidivaricata]KAG0363472.1 Era Like 12S Mitochondrial RRNA Chaperone 1 [Gamsiella multidivaricata]KAI7820530.1 P-loop containing nucleoside triphosphate hydrolase protein [Gamsiella multidivaricata]